MDTITYLPLKEIIPNKNNPRSEVDKNNLAELADSIKAVGIINPITVRNLNKDAMEEAINGNKFEIVSGERRFKAAEIAGLKTIPVIIRDLSDDQMMEVIIIENLQRKEVHPLDEATGFDFLMKTGRYKEEAIGDKVGKPASYVAKRLKLLNLIDQVKESFRKNELTLGHALEFARLNERQQDKMVKWMENNKYSNPTAARLKDAIQQTFHLKIKDAVFDTEDDLLLEDLPGKHKYAGVLSCKMCPKRTGFNTNLFDDITDDVCTDPECYNAKLTAHIQKTKSTYGEKGKPIVEYQHIEAQPSKEGVFTRKSDLVLIDKKNKKCPSAIDAIVTKIGPYHYDFNKQVGDIVKICKDPECKVHKRTKQVNVQMGSSSVKMTEAEKKKMEKAKLESQVINLAQTKAVMAIIKKLKYPLDDLILNELIDTIIDSWDWQNYMVDCKFITAEEIDGFDFEKYLSKHSNLDRMKLLAGYMLYDRNDLASKLYKKYRVDMAKLKKEARAELKKQQKEQAKAVDSDKAIPENPEDDGYETDEDAED